MLMTGCAVMVDVDRAVDVARCEGICEVAGVELSSAPRRPINFKTLLKKMDFVAYGENTDTCATVSIPSPPGLPLCDCARAPQACLNKGSANTRSTAASALCEGHCMRKLVAPDWLEEPACCSSACRMGTSWLQNRATGLGVTGSLVSTLF